MWRRQSYKNQHQNIYSLKCQWYGWNLLKQISTFLKTPINVLSTRQAQEEVILVQLVTPRTSLCTWISKLKLTMSIGSEEVLHFCVCSMNEKRRKKVSRHTCKSARFCYISCTFTCLRYLVWFSLKLTHLIMLFLILLFLATKNNNWSNCCLT